MMRHRLRRPLLAAALILLLLEPLYLIVGNAWLRGGRLRALLNRDPRALTIVYSSAWTVWPGVVHLRGFRIHNRTRAVEWQATLDSATVTISLVRLLRREEVTADVVGYRAIGSGSLEWRVAKEQGEPRGRLIVELADFRVGRKGEPRPHVVGRGLRIETVSRGLAVDALPSPLALTVTVPDARVPDFRVYNSLLPAGSGLVIRSGSARLRARFAAAAPSWNGDGDLWLTGDRILAAFEETVLAGDVHLHTRLHATARPLVLDVSGSEFAIDHATVQGRSAGGGWRAQIRLGRAAIRPGERLFLHAELTGQMSDPRPLFALFTPTRGRILTWLERLLEVRGLAATGTLSVGSGVVALDRLHVAGGKAEMDARLRVVAGNRRGLLYARLGPFAAGFELRGRERSWKLLGARRWYEAEGRRW